MSVTLIPMAAEDYGPWLQAAVRGYAEEHIEGGRWTAEDALSKSAAEFKELLPDGLATTDNYLVSIREETAGPKVGYLWFAVVGPAGRRQAFVYDFVVFEPFRRQGYGSRAFAALETHVRALGLGSIGLHVFGHNLAARRLYQKLGYRETHVQMRKDL